MPRKTKAETGPAIPAPARENKTGKVLALLRREQGSTLAEICELTGWQQHSARAALTGLRKKGHLIEKSKRDTTTCYRIADPA